MKTAREIFERAIALLGQEKGENTEVFETRAPSLTNLLLAQLWELDLSLKGQRGTCSSCPQIRTLEDAVGMEDAILLSTLPLGLAALLIQEEEPERSEFFWHLFQNEKETLRSRCKKTRRHKITRSF